MLERLCAEAGFEPDIAYVVQDVTVARAFVAAGLSVALMPELTIPEPRADVVVRPARGVNPFRSLHAIWLRDRQVPSLARMVRYLADAATARLA
jgi:DNA-binding transcriptional LysR family regulator